MNITRQNMNTGTLILLSTTEHAYRSTIKGFFTSSIIAFAIIDYVQNDKNKGAYPASLIFIRQFFDDDGLELQQYFAHFFPVLLTHGDKRQAVVLADDAHHCQRGFYRTGVRFDEHHFHQIE